MLYNSEYCFFAVFKDYEKDKIEKQIESFGRFESGWSFGEGLAFAKNIIEKAISIYRIGRSYGLLAEAIPGIDGDITIIFQVNDNFLDIDINDNTYTIDYERGIGKNFIRRELGEFTELNKVKEKIKWLSSLERKSSGYSTYCISANEKKDLKIFLKSQKTRMDSQYLMMNAG